MGPKKFALFQDIKLPKISKNVTIKFDKKLGPDGEEIYDTTGPSKFVLKNLKYYSVHPNMAKYYEPLKPSKLQRSLAQRNAINSFMVQVTEYDQNLTLLLMTNNPPPCSVSQQEKEGAPKYFPPEFQFKERLRKPTKNFRFSTVPQKTMLRPELKPVFPMKGTGGPTPKKQQWFRFSTDKDFKTEGKYSEIQALRKQKKLYPKLIFAPTCQREARKSVSDKSQEETSTSPALWEPLTFSKLLEQNPTRAVPGESVFRYGRAPQWIVKNATVTK